MASSGLLLPEELYHCSICLDVFISPISLPCGHSFCMACIREYWSKQTQSRCPMCMRCFENTPELHVNTCIAEIANHFRRMLVNCSVATGEVPCDVCTGQKLRAQKSCLVCLTSYCETHLEPHLRVATLKRHKLVDPVKNLEDRMCKEHERPLQLFCKQDQMCVCVLCTETEHEKHDTVPVERQWAVKKIHLEKRRMGIQQMIQDRVKKVEEIEQLVKRSKVRTEKEIEDSVRVFTDLIQSIERTRVELLEVIEEKQKAAERRAADLIKEMEAEITELQRRSTELEELSQTEDHIYFLQSFPPPCDDPQTKDWSDIIIHTDHCVGTKWNVYGQLGEHISKVIDEQLQSELRRIQKYAVDVTFDPKTAHPTLLLSKDGKRVHDGDTVRNVPDNPQRFDCCLCVMATEGFTTGRHYWEVVVKNKTNWDLGVVRESINRKGELTAFPENGFWTIWHRNGTEYSANCSPPVALSLAEKPQKVGVYVDYEQGQVSFYNVDKRSSICTFTGYTFKGKLYPFFSPCHNDGVNNSSPLIISSISHAQ
ncbi:E3 ubiquitin-protein ligase TRIM39-like [Paramormyrops kingsleyae]|uniref:E3 ubiquitin-protein ligase TRIM39-like n=1 Tax=Paramormyrops kingsleyae TaxID=1676925 RepID=UPI000CD612B4|nr:E3 ubiquitin-protein ligase TRIM39-like [Paramormyrops kingsleyae]